MTFPRHKLYNLPVRCFIGTSGWQYSHWKGIFYPEVLKSADWLSFYAQHLNTIEINVTFYRDVRASTYKKWYSTVPDGFLFSLKMSRFITHIKRLKIESTSMTRFMESASFLQDKLGVILIQLPPGLRYDKGLMQNFLEMLDKGFKYTIEVRHNTFINDTFFSLLKEKDIALCIADTAGRFPYCEEITAQFVYIRLHGAKRLYASNYSDEELRTWRDRILLWGKETFIYFDNDFMGYAVKNAIALKKML
jgi:uncharacterized protein YecE (DUF72 family)